MYPSSDILVISLLRRRKTHILLAYATGRASHYVPNLTDTDTDVVSNYGIQLMLTDLE